MAKLTKVYPDNNYSLHIVENENRNLCLARQNNDRTLVEYHLFRVTYKTAWEKYVMASDEKQAISQCIPYLSNNVNWQEMEKECIAVRVPFLVRGFSDVKF